MCAARLKPDGMPGSAATPRPPRILEPFPMPELSTTPADVAARFSFRELRPVVDALASAFSSFNLDPCTPSRNSFEAASNLARSLAISIHYSASDLEKFSLSLPELQGQTDFSDRAGLFLSALVNAGGEKRYEIQTSQLSVRMNFLGMQCAKLLVVNGGVGDYLGDSLDGGILVIHGDAGNCVGQFMRSGSITVTGDVGFRVGFEKISGVISVHGTTLGQP